MNQRKQRKQTRSHKRVRQNTRSWHVTTYCVFSLTTPLREIQRHKWHKRYALVTCLAGLYGHELLRCAHSSGQDMLNCCRCWRPRHDKPLFFRVAGCWIVASIAIRKLILFWLLRKLVNAFEIVMEKLKYVEPWYPFRPLVVGGSWFIHVYPKYHW